jgi:hypothetical protein
MSRMIQARVMDEQYDWLVERAIDEHGDMSEAIRGTIDMARIFGDLLNSPNPPQALQEFLDYSAAEQAREEAEAARAEEW